MTVGKRSTSQCALNASLNSLDKFARNLEAASQQIWTLSPLSAAVPPIIRLLTSLPKYFDLTLEYCISSGDLPSIVRNQKTQKSRKNLIKILPDKPCPLSPSRYFIPYLNPSYLIRLLLASIRYCCHCKKCNLLPHRYQSMLSKPAYLHKQ